jgi:hypothetical protein
MSDDQWLGAIAKHSSDDRPDYSRLTGGAHEQAMVLQRETKANPQCFASLALRFDNATNPAYPSAVLRGLSEADDADPHRIFEGMRHVAGLRIAGTDQALVNSLRRRLDADRLAAGLRNARDTAVDGFSKLIEAPDELLGTDPVEELIVYVGFGDSVSVEPVIPRMLRSEVEAIREAGGRLAAFAGLELDLADLLDVATGLS